MAFFKFPWFSQPQAPDKGNSRRGRAAQAESMEELRRRARQRLIGAVVLVLIGVIVFPMVFDTQPRTVPVKVSIDIPDRHTAGPLVIGAAPATAADAAKTAVGAGLADGEEQVPASPAKPAAAAATTAPPQAAPIEGAEAKAPAKPEPRAEARPEPKPEPKAESKHAVAPAPAPVPAPAASATADAARARALLEGKSGAAGAAAAAAPAANAQADRFIVQVGAYADQAKVREVRARLERAGLKTYAQDIQGKEGMRTTRVRLGPFANRAEAARVLDRIKGLGLDGAILTL
nr:SPOR domain-containing protein [Comamonas badia]